MSACGMFPGQARGRDHRDHEQGRQAHLLLVIYCPVDLVVVTRSEIDHDVLLGGRGYGEMVVGVG